MRAKKILIMAVVMMLVVCMLMTSCKKDQPPVDYGESGTYYCDINGKEYNVTLSNNKDVTLNLGADTDVKGSYVYDGAGALTITLEDKSTVSVAVNLEKGELKLTYKGLEYSLIIKKDYKVSFDTAGGSAIADVTVVNGRTVAKPANPTKEGYIFVGWYAEKEYKTAYDFDAKITKDTTVYARFVEKVEGQTEFEADFNLGYEGAPSYDKVATNGGVLYNLPTPEREGYTFLGWWVSDYNSADKLTYKYEENKLTKNVTLFAVWSGEAPAVSVTDKGVSWNNMGAGKSYTVTITKPDGTKETQPVGALEYAFDFTKAPAGEYVIEVEVDGKTGSAYVLNRPLDKATGLTHKDGTVFVFAEVENADYYLLKVSCGNPYHDHSAGIRLEKGATSFDFAQCDMQKGGIKFVVEAYSDNYMTSVSEEYVFEQTLAQPGNMVHDTANETVKWDAVPNAQYYKVTLTNNGTVIGQYEQTETMISVKHYTGSVSVTVVPVAKMYNSAEVAEVAYTTTRLPAPQGIKVDIYTATWTPIEGAVKYVVSIAGKTYETETASITLTDEFFTAGVFEYDMTVTAVAANAADNSVASDTTKLAVGNIYGELKYAANTLTWNTVIGAKGYILVINGGEEIRVSDASYVFASLPKEGENTFKVCCYLDDNATQRSEWIETSVVANKLTYNACGGYDASYNETSNLYLAVGDRISLQDTVYNAGYNFSGWYTQAEGKGESLGNTYTLLVAQDVEIYANWTPKQYKVTLSVRPGDGNVGGVQTSTITVTYNSAFTLPTAVSTNPLYAFAGWYSAENGYGTQYTGFDGASLAKWSDRNDEVVLYPNWVEVFSFVERENGTWAVNKGPGINYVTEVTIPAEYAGKKVTAVDTFASSSKLVTINIPDTVEVITIIMSDTGSQTGSAFASCSKLQNVNLYKVEGNSTPSYYSEDGIVYRYLDDDHKTAELVYVPKAKAGEVTVSDKTSEISAYMFNLTDITKVTIPASVRYIGKSAFQSCTSLEEVVFAKAAEGTEVPALTIANEAFRSCTALESIALPARLESIGLKHTNDSGTVLYNAFYLCSALSEIKIEEGGKAYADIDGVLVNAEKNTIIYVPTGMTPVIEVNGQQVEGRYRIPSGVSTIAPNAFYNCTLMTSLVIPGWVTTIDEEAFVSCTKMEELIFEGTRTDADLSIGFKAFYTCSALTEVVLPENLASVAQGAFGSCSKLLDVTLTSYVSPEEHAAYEEKRNNGTLTEDDKLYDFAEGAFATVTTTGTTIGTYYVTDIHFGEFVDAFDIGGVFGNKIVSITTDPNNKYIRPDEKGIIYNAAMTELIYFPASAPGVYVTPTGLEKIGASVFHSKTNLTSIVIGKDVTEIGTSAFSNCTKLESVLFEEGGTEPLVIGERAFYYCTNTAFTNIALPERTEVIMNYAFQSCTYLQKISLPSTIKQLGDYQEYEDVNVKDENGNLVKQTVLAIRQPYFATATSTTYQNTMGVFDSCNRLEEINVNAGGKHFVSENGILYGSQYLEIIPVTGEDGKVNYEYYMHEADGTPRVLYRCPAAASANNGTLTLPSTTTAVWMNALYYNGYYDADSGVRVVNCAPINNGTKTNTVELGPQVFYYAKALEAIDVPEGVTVMPKYMFYYCTSLKSVKVPTTVVSVQPQTFNGCSALETLLFAEGGTEELLFEDGKVTSKSTTTYYSTGVFNGCLALKEVVLPSRVTKIANAMFANCKALERVVIPATVTEIGEDAFAGCVALTDVVIPADSQITYIGGYAFDWTAITEFNCPPLLEKLGPYAFTKSAIKSFTFPKTLVNVQMPTSSNLMSSMVDSCSHLFEKCTELETVVFPSEMNFIAPSMFSECSSLKSVTFASDSTISEIPNYAFELCTSLTSIDIPGGVVNIGISAFEGAALTSIVLPENLTSIGNYAFEGCNAIKSVSVPASVTYIGRSAFAYCTELATVSFASAETCALTEIGNEAFRNTAITTFTFPENISYEIPEGETEQKRVVNQILVGESLFAGCPNLKTVSISESVFDLTNVFSGCATVENYSIDPENTHMKIDANLPFVVSADGKEIMLVLGDLGTQYSTLKIPEGYEVIAPGAFQGQENLKVVHIPSTMKSIGEKAFSFCLYLTDVVFEVDSELAMALNEIGNYAFQYTGIREFVIIPTNEERVIGNYAFYRCFSLKKVDLSGNVSTLGNYVFAECSALSDINLGNVTEFGSNAFNGCTSLETIYIPDSVTAYGVSGFANCAALKSIRLSESATKIPNTFFQNCTSLESIVIPNCVVDYGTASTSKLFQGCTALKTVILSESAPTLVSYMFDGCTSLESIVIPNCVTKYGTYMFRDCSSLKNVQLSQNSAAKTMVSYMFQRCTSLEKFDFPSNVTTYGTYMFQYCEKLADVTLSTNSAAKTLSSGMFDGCAAMKYIYIPDVVTTYGTYMFRGTSVTGDIRLSPNADKIPTSMFYFCEGITEFDMPSNVTHVGSSAFRGTSLTTVDWPNVKVFGSTTATVSVSTAAYVLGECPNLVSVKLTGLERMTGSCFRGSEKLETVEFSDKLTQYGVSTFEGCKSLKSVTMSNSATRIENNQFKDCTSLTSISLPDSITSVGYQAFLNSALTSLDLPASLEKTDYSAFGGKIDSFTIEDTNKNYKILNNGGLYCTSTGKVVTWPKTVTVTMESLLSALDGSLVNEHGTLKIDGGMAAFNGRTAAGDFDFSKLPITELGDFMFFGLKGDGTSKLVLPETIETIQQYALGATNVFESIVIPDSVSKLAPRAFDRCVTKQITIGSGVNNYGQYAFTKVEAEKVIFKESNHAKIEHRTSTATTTSSMLFHEAKIGLIDVSANYAANIVSSFARNGEFGEIIVRGPLANSSASYTTGMMAGSKVGKLTLDYEVTEIPMALYAGVYMDRVEIPATVKKLNNYAFADNHIGEIVFLTDSKGNSALTELGTYVFYRAHNETVVLPDSVKTIGNYGFRESDMKYIVLPESLETMGTYMFEGSEQLESVVMGDNVKTIGTYLFGSCPKLTNVKLSDGLETLGVNAFYNCTALKIVNIPKAMTKLPNLMFSGCSALETIVLHNEVTVLGNQIFEECTSLKSIVIPMSVIKMGNGVFAGWTPEQTLNFRCSMVIASTFVTSASNSWVKDCHAKLVFNYQGQ